jgi:polysaccharide export outer membrane protein
MAWTIGGLLSACLLYCLIAPNVFEASGRIALRGTPATALNLDGNDTIAPGAFASGQIQLETLAGIFRSEQLAWRVIIGQKLYLEPSFAGNFAHRFPRFDPKAPVSDARALLLDGFQKQLTVQTLPRTLILQIRFRSNDPAVSAKVVNALIQAYEEQAIEIRVQGTAEATSRLNSQLIDLKQHVENDDRLVAEFQKKHGILNVPEILANGQPSDVEHSVALREVDELSREEANAAADSIQREAEYRAALAGDPESVLAWDPGLQSSGSFASALLQQLHSRRSNLEQEESELRIEHGPNFPRVVEIRGQVSDIDRQIASEDSKLVERYRSAWKTAAVREELVRNKLEKSTGEGMKLQDAVTAYAAMRQEANSDHDLYLHMMEKTEEAGLAAGVRNTDISIVDYAREPIRPVAPDLLLYMAITLFCAIWLAIGGALLMESIHPYATRIAAGLVLSLVLVTASHAQAPTPSTSGLPTGVARLPQSSESKSQPNAKDAPEVWNTGQRTGLQPASNSESRSPMPGPIGGGDLLEISEAHTPEFRASVRVSETGTVTLALAGEVQIGGMNETGAARAIEAALVEHGMLIHPMVTVLITASTGQDVSVLGEVGRPGIYPYAIHHRLLDLISAASGLTPNAGSLVTIRHREEQSTYAVALDPIGADSASDHNPALLPGDTVQVNRAGLVYVVGDVIRPGGFPVDPVQAPTVVQILSLAWGPGQNAALTRAILIREQPGGRTITNLNLKRMLRGLDPDLTIRDRDILFVPDSVAKNLWNRTMESVIQSAAGVSIYAGLVYSQRF